MSERAKQVEILVTDSVTKIDTNETQLNIGKKDIIVVRRFKYTEAQPASIDNLGNTLEPKFEAAKYFILIAGFILIFFLFLSFFQSFWRPGCYIATMVYESYEAPEVKTLRKFRDDYLLKTFLEKNFVGWYYLWSPVFTKIFAGAKGLHKVIKYFLDKIVRKLDTKMKKS